MQVAALTRPYLIRDADLVIALRPSAFGKVVRFYSTVSALQRPVVFEATGTGGRTWNAAAGHLSCGAFADVGDGSVFQMEAAINSLSDNWQADGSLAVRFDFALKAAGELEGRIYGPPGLCSVPDLKKPSGGWSCNCPIGGAIDDKLSLAGEQAASVTGKITFIPQADGSLGYDLSLPAPIKISPSANFGPFKLGKIDVPFILHFPAGSIASGKGFGLLRNSGVMQVGGEERTYRLELENLATQLSPSGFDLHAKGAVQTGTAQE